MDMVFNHTSSRPHIKYQAPDPDTFKYLIDNLKSCSTSDSKCKIIEESERAQDNIYIQPRRKKHYYPGYTPQRQPTETHLSYG